MLKVLRTGSFVEKYIIIWFSYCMHNTFYYTTAQIFMYFMYHVLTLKDSRLLYFWHISFVFTKIANYQNSKSNFAPCSEVMFCTCALLHLQPYPRVYVKGSCRTIITASKLSLNSDYVQKIKQERSIN